MEKFTPLLSRLSEKSTVVGLLSLVTVAVGYGVAPDRLDAIATLVSAVAGTALVLTKEAK